MNQKHYNELMKIAADLETEGDGAIAKSLRAAIATPTPLADAAAMAEREALRSLLSEAFDAGWDRSDECDNAYNNGTSEQLMVPPQAQEPEVFQKWRAEYFSDRNEVVSALLARAEGEFKWPPLPALPEKSWNVAGHAYFTEHQMQGYANAYGEAVRAALATTEATDAVRFFWQQHTLSDTSAMSMAELHNDTECVIRGHRAATMTDAIAPTEGAVPVDLITALSIARQFVPNGTEAAERVDAAMGAALSAPSPEAPAVDARDAIGQHDLSTSAGGRGYVAEFFAKRVLRHDFKRYIEERLAADFACALAGYLSERDAAPAVDALTTGAVAFRVEQRAGRYTFVEHVENLKLYAGANIVPLFRAFRSVDADLDTLLDRLESMVTWEPRLLSGPEAIDRLEHINRALYEFLNPHPARPASEPQSEALTTGVVAEVVRYQVSNQEQFEKFARRQGYSLGRTPGSSTEWNYLSRDTYVAFVAWQASRHLASETKALTLTDEQIRALRKASAVLCGTGHHDEASEINALLADRGSEQS